MITAIDTNILIDIFGVAPKFYAKSAEAVRRCEHEGSVIACDVVWAEVAAAFSDAKRFQIAMSTLPASYSPISQEGLLTRMPRAETI